MATIPRTYLTTSKTGLSSVPLRNGQVISIWDNDEVWYDAPANGERDGNPVRRKISGVRIVSTLPDNPMTDIVYVYIGDHGTLPETGDPIYDLRVWVNNEWLIVGNNWEDSFVKSVVSDGKFYLVGTPDITETVGSLLKNSAVYVEDGKLYGYLEGTAHYATEATHSSTADLATQAINDNFSTPQPITSYIRGVMSDATTNLGTTLTLTKGDGTTSTIRVSDTTYDVFTQDPTKPGLVNGINTTVGSDNTDLLLTGSGWVDKDNIVMPAADSATKDGLGQNIANTYVKGLAWSAGTLTITVGNDSTSTISIPDTTYSVFTTSTDGLVPASSGAGETAMFLRGDHTWQPITVNPYQGATAIADGVDGLVPHAQAGEQNYYLKGDGTWGTTFSAGVDGLVPAPTLADEGKSLKVNSSGVGVWEACTDTQNTAGALNDVSNSLYLVGATAQSSSVITNTNQYVYIQGNRLYQSNGAGTPTSIAVADVSSTQALTNKTYEGYTLGDACAKTVASTVQANDNLPTNNAVMSYTSTRVNQVRELIGLKLDSDAVAATYNAPVQDAFTGDGSTTTFTLTNSCSGISAVYVDGTEVTTGYSYDSVTNSVTFTTAPANDKSVVISYNRPYAVGDYCIYDDGNGMRLYRCKTAITTAEAFDSTKWDQMIISDCLGLQLTGTLAVGNTTLTFSDSRITANSMVDYYTDTYGVSPSDITVSAGQIVFTFPAQANAVNVKVVLR